MCWARWQTEIPPPAAATSGIWPRVTRSSSFQEKPEIWIFSCKFFCFWKCYVGLTKYILEPSVFNLCPPRRVLENQPQLFILEAVTLARPVPGMLQPSGTWSTAWWRRGHDGQPRRDHPAWGRSSRRRSDWINFRTSTELLAWVHSATEQIVKEKKYSIQKLKLVIFWKSFKAEVNIPG